MTQSINVTVPPPINVTIGQGQGGARGPQGLQGIQGPQGRAEDVSYRHLQGVSSDQWDITHNLGFYPNVTVINSLGNMVEGELTYLDANTIRLNFTAPFSGAAYLS